MNINPIKRQNQIIKSDKVGKFKGITGCKNLTGLAE